MITYIPQKFINISLQYFSWGMKIIYCFLLQQNNAGAHGDY